MEELGADALSVITPYFLTPTEEELVQHFTAVAESVSIPIILYNIPKATGCNLSAEVVGRLAEVENIRGIKDLSLIHIFFFSRAIALLPKSLSFIASANIMMAFVL